MSVQKKAGKGRQWLYNCIYASFNLVEIRLKMNDNVGFIQTLRFHEKPAEYVR